jgi:hypothetical protein
MRSLALLIALLAVVVGFVALIKPEVLLALGDRVVTPAGLYGIGALRVLVGIVLVLVARESRTPTVLRVIGVVVVLAGLALPILGIERTRAIMDWQAMQSGALLRLAGLVIVAFAAFLAFSVGGARRRA